VDIVTEEIIEKIKAICEQYLDRDKCAEAAKAKLKKAAPKRDPEQEARQIESKINSLNAKLDNVYSDKLSGALDEGDFQRIYAKIKQERLSLQEKLKNLSRKQKEGSPSKIEKIDMEALIKKFLDTVDSNKELLVSLIERIELTEEKEIKIFFRFSELAPQNLQ